jgi:hypothetical protein
VCPYTQYSAKKPTFELRAAGPSEMVAKKAGSEIIQLPAHLLAAFYEISLSD